MPIRHLTIGLLLFVCAFALADEPLRVYTSGAPGASVYVTPQSATGADAASSADVGLGAFAPKFLRGKTPLEVKLAPGLYLVSVMPQPDYTMRDGMMKCAEFVWDGYDYHALVDQKNTRFRYAQCYLLEKIKDQAAEVLAVFTDQRPDGVALSFDLGKKATRFTAGEEAAAKLLDDALIPPAYVEDAIQGLQAGMKVILREGADRWVITTDGPEKIKVLKGHGAGAWAGHRLSVCAGEQNLF